MRPPCRRTRPSGDSDAHEAKFPRLEEAGQAALEVAQEEDAPQKTGPKDAQGLSLAVACPGPSVRSSLSPSFLSSHPIPFEPRAEMTRRGSAEPQKGCDDPLACGSETEFSEPTELSEPTTWFAQFGGFR